MSVTEDSRKSDMPNIEISPAPSSQKHRVQFWGIFAALCILALISALDVAIIATALPTITAEVGGADKYVWIANSFVIGSSIPQPLYGQLANVLGRRIPLVLAILLFILGSGIAGGAHDSTMVIAGRTVQGLGAGGIYVLIDIVCCDLVPPRNRGKFLGLMFSWSGLGAAIGPVLGGTIAEANWRWIFYLNIPICSLALAILLIFMRRINTGNSSAQPTPKIKQVDFIGSFIFIPSTIAILLGLIMGGMEYSWSSWHVVLPLVLGIFGWALFHIYEAFTDIPSVPGRLFKNRTTSTAYFLAFVCAILVQAMIYFIPVYFQGVIGVSVFLSGVDFLPFAIGTLFFAVVSGLLLERFGVYRPLHVIGFSLSIIGYGILMLLRSNTSKVGWAFFQIIASSGPGMAMSVLLPAALAPLPESDVAAATATFSFIRTFGFVWGVTIPSIIFNAFYNRNLHLIADTTLRNELRDGAAYAFASQVYIRRNEFPKEIWDQIKQVYLISLKAVWLFGLGLSIVGFFAVGFEKQLPLRRDLDTEYGLGSDGNAHNEGQEEKQTGSERDHSH
ncbi:MFS general substrate transporter [Xylaria telfairii]|nr:MFS general substrate transporter [Xylaria telfairii]